MDRTLLPFGCRRGSIAFTLPETVAWTGALTKPPASAIGCPRSTVSPTETIGFAGAPMCMETGRITSSGNASFSIGLVFVADL